MGCKVGSDRISFVIQGPIYPDITEKSIKSVRRIFPESEIIVTTWSGSDLSKICADKVISQDDPGSYYILDSPKIASSTNRQLLSTRVGLENATREYAVKMRSDMEFIHDGFLNFFERFKKRSELNKFSRERFVLSTIAAPNPRKYPILFHPSDWFYFGNIQDMKELFSSPLAVEPETSRWFESRPQLMLSGEPWLCRFRPEQYIWLNYLRNYISIPMEHAYDFTIEKVQISEQIFANNSILLDPNRIGYRSFKHVNLMKNRNIGYFSPMLQFSDWEYFYQQYCDQEYRPQRIDFQRGWRTLAWALEKFRVDRNCRELLFVIAKLSGFR